MSPQKQNVIIELRIEAVFHKSHCCMALYRSVKGSCWGTIKRTKITIPELHNIYINILQNYVIVLENVKVFSKQKYFLHLFPFNLKCNSLVNCFENKNWCRALIMNVPFEWCLSRYEELGFKRTDVEVCDRDLLPERPLPCISIHICTL